ncbi:class I SAM-dependent methyltransferase [Isoptericola sp. F-RaC21]|uniref:class I SAM-dependent methyltransferase n=1 Tax=Isoptericola sp. F-RaC21 TaxID=3141452 RepID=UPI00315BBD12
MTDTSRAASRTAVLVCQGRAAAQGRLGPGRFDDPMAQRLLDAEELVPVRQVREGRPPEGWGPRTAYEQVRACADLMAARTVVIDEAVRAHANPQVVLLGAGLDSRAWRMPELADVDVLEVDHPASQRDKRRRVGDAVPPVRLAYAPVDLARDRLADGLAAAGHRAGEPTTWVWEGVVPYLTRAQAADTVRQVAALSAPGSALVVNYQAPSLRATVGRRVAGVLAAAGGHRPMTAGEPWRAAWAPRRMAALLRSHGFDVVADGDLSGPAADLGVPGATTTSLRTGRVAVAVRPGARRG